MFERFTERTRQAMQQANQEAQRLHHEYIGTEHILLGLIKVGEGMAITILNKMGVNLHDIKADLEQIVVAGPDLVTMGKLPQTPRTKKVVEYALEESRMLNQSHVGTEHLLLGLLREEGGLAAQVLTKLGVKIADVRNHASSATNQGAC